MLADNIICLCASPGPAVNTLHSLSIALGGKYSYYPNYRCDLQMLSNLSKVIQL